MQIFCKFNQTWHQSSVQGFFRSATLKLNNLFHPQLFGSVIILCVQMFQQPKVADSMAMIFLSQHELTKQQHDINYLILPYHLNSSQTPSFSGKWLSFQKEEGKCSYRTHEAKGCHVEKDLYNLLVYPCTDLTISSKLRLLGHDQCSTHIYRTMLTAVPL